MIIWFVYTKIYQELKVAIHDITKNKIFRLVECRKITKLLLYYNLKNHGNRRFFLSISN